MRISRNRFFLAALTVILVFSLWARQQYVIPVIMYHSIDDNAGQTKLSVYPESFERHMVFLKERDYNVVPFDELPGMIRKGKIPRKTIAITFDDGFENNYEIAYPVLKELGLPATIFISPGKIGREGYLNWGQVKEMSDSGIISIGSHTITHAYLPGMSDDRLDVEIVDSKRVIEERIGKPATEFSYPLGGFDQYIKNKVISAGYRVAAATNPGKDYPAHDIFAMKRVRISRTSDNLFVFWIETSGFYTWIKEHRDED